MEEGLQEPAMVGRQVPHAGAGHSENGQLPTLGPLGPPFLDSPLPLLNLSLPFCKTGTSTAEVTVVAQWQDPRSLL